ncbi:hypothetical protein QJS10_CPB04g01365 [Acorus calamus]|uniref:OB domain-containing protein n=1 Tax=Acorus calamus TaxID=4465 RepID=A0AAV9EZX5_ACOCL|nr:hypothetical protein QJS10_CPB04g01365 [Acorus calamus]
MGWVKVWVESRVAEEDKKSKCFRTRDQRKTRADGIDERDALVEELRSRGYEPYAYSWERTHTAAQLQDVYKDLENGEMRAEDSVSAAGRITGRRAFGKLVFLTLSDDTGNIQLYFEKESLPADQFEQLKKFIDLSDIIGASGSIKRTEKADSLSKLPADGQIGNQYFDLPIFIQEMVIADATDKDQKILNHS